MFVVYLSKLFVILFVLGLISEYLFHLVQEVALFLMQRVNMQINID